jgi:hypothetical protein
MGAPLDQTRVLAALAAIAKAAPDLRPVYHCDGGELDFEVPHQGAATDITHLLDGIRPVRSTAIHGGGYAGTIAGTPVRVLITRNRGRGWAA